ncbi:MAG: prepilin-type N-terminal cleavage/methylation domain-containing protein [Actinomycetota bacterium]|nr:prepilin-type N-terminal cleavage/methylation domain-containing protein [Actinomycetota bacterium]
MSAPRCARARGDDGVTIVEVMVVTALMGVVAAALGGVLVSMGRIEARSAARYEAGAALSLALDRMANEVRSGAPSPEAPPGGPSGGVTMVVRRGDGAMTVRWSFEDDALVRAELDADGAVTTAAEVVTGVVAAESTVRHLDPLGVPVSGGWEDVVACAASIEMTVVVERPGVDLRSARVMTYRLRSEPSC